MLTIYDATAGLSAPPKPIEWLIDGVLPVGTVGDIYAPPGEGKSTILLDLALTLAAGRTNWYGHACRPGKVAIIGGETSSETAFIRNLHRVWGGNQAPDPKNLECINSGALWKWNRDAWEITPDGAEMLAYLASFQPSLVLIDTITRAAAGGSQIDNLQQALLGITIEQFAKTLNTTLLTISHTNQASIGGKLHERLHYTSRAGGNGLPGIFRWAAGMSRLNAGDQSSFLPEDLQMRKIIAFAVSKHNEMPTPAWNIFKPALFEVQPDGSVAALPGEYVGTPQPRRDYEETAKMHFADDRKATAKMLKEQTTELKKQQQEAREQNEEKQGAWFFNE